MLLFAITGILLNHAPQIESVPQLRSVNAQVPEPMRQSLGENVNVEQAALPLDIAKWLEAEVSVELSNKTAEWSDDEVYLSLPGPGTDAWLAIDRTSGDFEFERTDRGWIAYFNDLHKGRHTGAAWRWFLDLFSISTVVFCLTGLLLMVQHARHRPLSWPLVGLGFIAPALIAILFIH